MNKPEDKILGLADLADRGDLLSKVNKMTDEEQKFQAEKLHETATSFTSAATSGPGNIRNDMAKQKILFQVKC